MISEDSIHRYTSRFLEDKVGGCAGLELSRTEVAGDPQPQLVATVIYWDATGSWAVQVFDNAEIPLSILERLVQEAKHAVFPQKSPRITHLSWGSMEVENVGSGRDFKLYPGGGRPWDWRETDMHHVPGIRPVDVQELLDNGSQVVVLSRGMELKLQTCPETLQMLSAKGVAFHVEETTDAMKLYNQLAEDGKAVGGLFHSTC